MSELNIAAPSRPSLDFRGKNLQNKDFSHHKDLRGANFSGCDLRSANFSNIDLSGADFSGSRLGVSLLKGIFVNLYLGLLQYLVFFIWRILARFAPWQAILDPTENIGASAIALAALIGTALAILYIVQNGFSFDVNLLVLSAVGLAGTDTVWLVDTITTAVAGTYEIAGTGAIALAGAVAAALAVAGTAAIAGAGLVADTITSTMSVVIAILIAGVVALASAVTFTGAITDALMLTLSGSAPFIFPMLAFGRYVAGRVNNGDPKYAKLANFGANWFDSDSTRFDGTNLQGANFAGAHIHMASFLRANLTNVNWRGVKNARFALFDGYMQDRALRDILFSGIAKGADFSGKTLAGASFAGFDLRQASFADANLNNANFSKATLKMVNFARANLMGAKFCGADLSGACISEWNVTGADFEDVICEEIFVDTAATHRKPDNIARNFAPGEFVNMTKQLANTLDLYFQKSPDFVAALSALGQLARNNPKAQIEFLRMEKKSNGAMLMQATVAEDANKSQLNQGFQPLYEHNVLLQQQNRELSVNLESETDRKTFAETVSQNLTLQDTNLTMI